MKVTWTQEEVCSLTGLEPHILRFWEGEFPQLRPRRNSAGQRVYRERDVDIVGRLKGWIYDEGLAIPAARRRLKEEFDTVQPPADPEQLGMPFLEPAPAPAPRPSKDETAKAVTEPIDSSQGKSVHVPEPAPEAPAASGPASAATLSEPSAAAPESPKAPPAAESPLLSNSLPDLPVEDSAASAAELFAGMVQPPPDTYAAPFVPEAGTSSPILLNRELRTGLLEVLSLLETSR